MTTPSSPISLDQSDSSHTAYRLPERAELTDRDNLERLISELETHTSRLRFQLFLQQLAAHLPDAVQGLCVYHVDGMAYGKPGLYWKGYMFSHPNAEGKAVDLKEQEPDFWQRLHQAAYPDDQGFWDLVKEHLGSKQALKPLTKTRALSLVDKVIPAARLAHRFHDDLNQSLEDVPEPNHGASKLRL